MNVILQLLHKTRRLVLRLLRWKTEGVKVMLFNPQGELLLVRNSYGRSDLFLLPGGGIERGEDAATAAAREIREEVGLEVEALTPFATYLSEHEGRRDTVHLFTATTAEAPEADGLEVEEARFFPLDALPAKVSPATLRRIEEYRGERPVEACW